MEEEEKTDAYCRYSFPHWRAECDHLHSNDWGQAGPQPPVPVTQVTSTVLGTHRSGQDHWEVQLWVWEGGDWGGVRSNHQWGGVIDVYQHNKGVFFYILNWEKKKKKRVPL